MTSQLRGYPDGLPESAPDANRFNPVNLRRVVDLPADRTAPEAPDSCCWSRR